MAAGNFGKSWARRAQSPFYSMDPLPLAAGSNGKRKKSTMCQFFFGSKLFRGRIATSVESFRTLNFHVHTTFLFVEQTYSFDFLLCLMSRLHILLLEIRRSILWLLEARQNHWTDFELPMLNFTRFTCFPLLGFVWNCRLAD